MKFIDKLPLIPLVMISVMLGLAPFVPEPHLWEKLKMLTSGELSKPIDIFDLLMHGTPAILLVIKLARGKKSAE
ncbi:MAG: RND transporter [Gammaproteobacteria bacterium]|nr:RND transporter [Gammaproteobacteria bacterium]